MSVPSKWVLEAFGARAEPRRLTGGQGTTYRAGALVLKPAPDDEEAAWIAEVYRDLKGAGFRVPSSVVTGAGW